MALKIADRVKETSATTGTGTFTLVGAMTGFKRFFNHCVFGDLTYYTIMAVDASGQPTGQWETGLGTYGPTEVEHTLARTTLLDSSTVVSGVAQLVNFTAGTKQVWMDWPARQILRTQFRGDNGNYGFGIGATGGEPARHKIHVIGSLMVAGTDGGTCQMHLGDSDLSDFGGRWSYVGSESLGGSDGNLFWGVGPFGYTFGFNATGVVLYDGKSVQFVEPTNPFAGIPVVTHELFGSVGAPNDADGKPNGSIYLRQDGATCIYRKESGVYVAKL